MTYRDLLIALSRLSVDPRIHPNTPVLLLSRHESGDEDGNKDAWYEQEPLIEIGIEHGTLVLSAEPLASAVVR
jgi:hypothetical protein